MNFGFQYLLVLMVNVESNIKNEDKFMLFLKMYHNLKVVTPPCKRVEHMSLKCVPIKRKLNLSEQFCHQFKIKPFSFKCYIKSNKIFCRSGTATPFIVSENLLLRWDCYKHQTTHTFQIH